ncbi:MAG: hypothetical protein SGCHY_004536 [Lobulomycetales sp.]
MAQQTMQTAGSSSRVFKSECTRCFRTSNDREGLFVCMRCFNGSCSSHAPLHCGKVCTRNGSWLAANIKTADPEPPAAQENSKLTDLSIKAEDAASKTPRLISAEVISFNSNVPSVLPAGNEYEAHLKAIVDAQSAKAKSDVKAWSNELVSCVHVDGMVQDPQFSLAAKPKCADCDLQENLWMCLVCGYVSCGRQQYGGGGGNGHGLEHNAKTGHQVAVKLGTITPEGSADIFCYHCGDERIDPQLGKHLATLGIHVSDQQKTEKSLTELQIEQNQKFDFSMTTADGIEFAPVSGAGLVGMKNLGNTCYMASLMQVFCKIPEFVAAFNSDAHFKQCCTLPADCFRCQAIKLVTAVASGDPTTIQPQMWKDLIGRGHPEFSTMRQQDAMDYFLHLIQYIEQKDQQSSVKTGIPELFSSTMETRMECLDCHKVRYSKTPEVSLNLDIPPSATSMQTCIDAYFSESRDGEWKCPADGKRCNFSRTVRVFAYPRVLVCVMKRFVIGEGYVMKKLVDAVTPPLSLSLDTVRSAGGPVAGETLIPETEAPAYTQATVDQLVGMGFPEHRAIKAVVKTGDRDADTAMVWLLDHMEDADIDDPLPTGGSNGGAPVDEGLVANLTDMGFSAEHSRTALRETGGDMERAVTWIFSHPEGEGASAPATARSNEPTLDTGAANYQLTGFISHKGTSTGCGHYVAHLNIPDSKTWVLMNDEKVVSVPETMIGKALDEGYVYFYRRI